MDDSPLPTPATPSPAALSGTDHVVALADGLSACADELHARILQEIASYEGKHVPHAVRAKLRALFDDESLLRQRANSLYTDAATLVVQGLGKSQQQLTKLTADAAEKIRRIGVIGEATSLVGGLLSLAGAAASGQPPLIMAAFLKLEQHAQALQALAPPPAKS